MAHENLQLQSCADCVPSPNGCACGIFENRKDHEKDGEQHDN